ncbi:glutamine synthetase family protein [Streptomyces olivaceus]|uniref:glutamine synthetase family protein n=1 Tax=Streptomyces TaxID=1883 RepID=UPI001CCEFDA9|nr:MULTISPECIES: glutamine synthetase family protein [Streptomyces]MBZ6247444.1 glutamine synthetase family protein [Streptomyces olivaceus]MCU8591970.1 glutamine synthetase family protein [Streptomyces sp. A13(2022)]
MAITYPRAERAAQARSAATGLAADGIDAVLFGWVDNAGLTRVKSVPLPQLEHAAEYGVGAAPCFDLSLVDDSFAVAPSGTGPVGDLRLVPDLDRLVPLAAQPGWAWAPADRWTQDGTPHPGCQRGFARRTAEAVERRGLSVRAGIEVEWVVADAAGTPATHAPAYGMTRVVEHSDYLREVLRALTAQGLEVLQLHPEYAAGQFEVSVAAEGPVEAADTTMLVRHTVRAVSARHGLRVSYAPVFTEGSLGNGSHLHLSLWREGRNLAHGGPGRHGLHPDAEQFLAGALAELPALLALGAPGVASYLRLVPSHFAGAYRCWGLENREAALRLITGSAAGQANAEFKCFDAAANPYLMIGGVLAAGLAGLDSGLVLPPETPGDPAVTGSAERLPASLPEAIAAYEKSALLRQALGGELYEAVLAVRQAEAELFAGRADADVVEAVRWRY